MRILPTQAIDAVDAREKAAPDERHGPGEIVPREVAEELARSRRYGRPFAVVGFGPAPPVAARRALAARVRTTDRMVGGNGSPGVLLLPETDGEMALSVVARLRGERPAILAVDVALAVAAFPEDGLTAAALVRVLEARIRDEQTRIAAAPRPDSAPPAPRRSVVRRLRGRAAPGRAPQASASEPIT